MTRTMGVGATLWKDRQTRDQPARAFQRPTSNPWTSRSIARNSPERESFPVHRGLPAGQVQTRSPHARPCAALESYNDGKACMVAYSTSQDTADRHRTLSFISYQFHRVRRGPSRDAPHISFYAIHFPSRRRRRLLPSYPRQSASRVGPDSPFPCFVQEQESCPEGDRQEPVRDRDLIRPQHRL